MPMKTENRKFLAAVTAASTAAILAAIKVVVGMATGSLVVIASAVDSLMDVACSGLNAFFLRMAAAPPDQKHAYGHGKAEALSGVIQATIIAVGGLWLVFHGVRRLIVPERLTNPEAAIAVTVTALAVSAGLVAYLRREARVTQSLALRADSFHYLTDLGTNAVAIAAVVGYRLLGWIWLDPAGSLLIAGYILWSAYGILREAADELLDRGLPSEVEDEVKGLLAGFAPEVRGYRAFRSRRAGGTRFFEFRLLVDRDTSFERSHEISESAIRRIRDRHGEATHVMVDTDPV